MSASPCSFDGFRKRLHAWDFELGKKVPGTSCRGPHLLRAGAARCAEHVAALGGRFLCTAFTVEAVIDKCPFIRELSEGVRLLLKRPTDG